MDTRPDTSQDTSTVDNYTLGQAAEQLCLSTKTLRRHIKTGKISATKTQGAKGPEWRLHKAEVDALVAQRTLPGSNSNIVRASVDTQLESMSVKMSSLMGQWVDKWADKTEQIVQGVQAGQQQQVEALGKIAEAIREATQQAEKVKAIEQRIELLEQQPRPWYLRAWQKLKGSTNDRRKS